MIKICLALILAMSLACSAQNWPGRRSSVMQHSRGEARTKQDPNRIQTQRTNDFQSLNRAGVKEIHQPSASPKYRRRPKHTYYPRVVRSYRKAIPNNGYEFQYLTEDGVQRAERGYLSKSGVWTVKGSVASLSDDKFVTVQKYIADGSGYKSSVKRYGPDTYKSLDDFLPWASVTDVRSGDNEDDDDKLGPGVIGSLLGGGG